MTHDTRSDAINGDKIKILVADDDLPTRVLLRAAITQWGYEVIEAGDGEAAWDILKEKDSPRILILDWMMPKLDGIGLCMRIKNELDYHPYIILLTQMSGTANVTKGLEAGADEFLSKPFNMAELKSRLSVGIKIIGYESQLSKQGANSNASQGTAKKADDDSLDHNANLTIMVSSAIINITSELNTLLNKISGALNAGAGDNADLKKKIERVYSLKTKLEQLTAIINKPVDDGDNRPRFTNANKLQEMLQSSLDACLMSLSDVKIDIDVSENIPEVLIDQSQLQKALIGIVINIARIIETSPQKNIRISFEKNDSSNLVNLTINCSGEVFTEEDFGKDLEDSFVSKNLNEKLPCVKTSYDLIKKNNGSLDIIPGKENGLQFLISLPYGTQQKEIP